MRKQFWLVMGLLAASLASHANAQEFPARPITFIVPWSAGGATDIVCRAIANAAAKHLGQPIIVDNKTGGGGTVGPATMAATAKPDGYTIAQIAVSVFRYPIMQSEVTYDPLKDFTYIEPKALTQSLQLICSLIPSSTAPSTRLVIIWLKRCLATSLTEPALESAPCSYANSFPIVRSARRCSGLCGPKMVYKSHKSHTLSRSVV